MQISLLKNIRKSIKDIDDSYNNDWDILAELCQNSCDAIKLKKPLNPEITLEINAANKSIIIEDNGQGCKDVNPGFGIHHLTERINLLQGRIRYYGDNGFELIVEIPMRRGENNG